MKYKTTNPLEPSRREFLRNSTATMAAAGGLGLLGNFMASPAFASGYAAGMTGGPTGFEGAERFQYNNTMSEGRAIEGIKALRAAGKVPQKLTMLLTDGAIGQITKPFPDGAPELWERTVNDSSVLATTLLDSRGQPVGFGVKFLTDSEDTRIINSEAIADSAWHLYVSGRGTLFIDQRENFWSYLRDVIVKASMNSADSWRGAWIGVMTSGPNPIGTARVIGGNGEFAGLNSEAVESLNATAYSAGSGPVAIEGSLVITVPDTPPESQTAQSNEPL